MSTDKERYLDLYSFYSRIFRVRQRSQSRWAGSRRIPEIYG